MVKTTATEVIAARPEPGRHKPEKMEKIKIALKDGGVAEVEAEEVFIGEFNFRFFLHESHPDTVATGEGIYTITELSTGRLAASGMTKAEAMKKARHRISQNSALLDWVINNYYEKINS